MGKPQGIDAHVQCGSWNCRCLHVWRSSKCKVNRDCSTKGAKLAQRVTLGIRTLEETTTPATEFWVSHISDNFRDKRQP